MSSRWSQTTIGQLCSKVLTGGTPLTKHKEYYEGGTIPWLKTKEVNFCRISETEYYISELGLNNSSAKLVPENSVIIAMYGQGDTAGRVAINKIPVTTNQACCNLVIDAEKADYRYIYYYLKNSYSELVRRKTGSAQPNLNTAIIKEFEIFAPPVSEQKKIGEILWSLDDKIEINRQTNQTLETIAQTLFKSWFVDFDPVKAKLSVLTAGGSAEEAERAAMCAISARDEASLNTLQTEQPEAYAELARTASLFPSAMQDSELGEIPEGWNISRLQDCCIRVEAGGTPKRSEASYWGGNIKWLSSGEVRNPIVLDTKERITELGLQKSTAKLWPKYSTIVAMYGATAGQVCLISQEMAANQACCALIPKQNYSAYIFLSARRSIEDLASKASGSAQQNLNKSLVSEHRVINPAENILKNFEKNISSLISKWEKNIEENKALEYTRDTLLPKLLSGELTLPENTPPKANPPESDTLEGQPQQQPLMEAAG